MGLLSGETFIKFIVDKNKLETIVADITQKKKKSAGAFFISNVACFCRLAKRWIASHFFSSFLEEEAIELLVAHLFLNPLPFCAPCSRTTGFLR